MNQKLVIATVLLSLTLLVSACGSAANTAATPEVIPPVIADDTIVAEGRLEPIHFAEIAFNAGGTVHEIFVKEGQSVKKGDVLIRIGDELDVNYAAAKLELANAQQAINDLKNTAGSDLAQVVVDLKEAKEEQKKAADYLHYLQTDPLIKQTENKTIRVPTDRGYATIYKQKNFAGPAPQDWIIEAQNDLAFDTARMEELQRAYDRMKDGVDQDQLALLEARLNAAQVRVASFSVTAPFDGVVAKMEPKVGFTVNPGDMAVTLADFSDWVVKTTDVTEIDVVRLQEGQVAEVTFDAIPDVELLGNVVLIGQTFQENQGDVVYEVTVVLPEGHPALRWGMTASVAFENEE